MEINKEFLDSLFWYLRKRFLKEGSDNFGCYWLDEIDKNNLPYKIVDKPDGTKQKFNCYSKKYKHFLKYEYCQQWTGMSCDDYEGYLFYPLPNGKFMKIWYNC